MALLNYPSAGGINNARTSPKLEIQPGEPSEVLSGSDGVVCWQELQAVR